MYIVIHRSARPTRLSRQTRLLAIHTQQLGDTASLVVALQDHARLWHQFCGLAHHLHSAAVALQRVHRARRQHTRRPATRQQPSLRHVLDQRPKLLEEPVRDQLSPAVHGALLQMPQLVVVIPGWEPELVSDERGARLRSNIRARHIQGGHVHTGQLWAHVSGRVHSLLVPLDHHSVPVSVLGLVCDVRVRANDARQLDDSTCRVKPQQHQAAYVAHLPRRQPGQVQHVLQHARLRACHREGQDVRRGADRHSRRPLAPLHGHVAAQLC